MGAATLFTGMVALRRHRVNEYTRYVSPPLRGGTRFTFLCPQSLDDVHEFAKSTGRTPLPDVEMILMTRRPTSAEEFMRHLPVVGQQFAGDEEEIFVNVCDPVRTPAHHDKAGWHERREIRDRVPPYWGHSVEVGDARSGLFFLLTHASRSHELASNKDDASIINSFQVLPPGVPVPK